MDVPQLAALPPVVVEVREAPGFKARPRSAARRRLTAATVALVSAAPLPELPRITPAAVVVDRTTIPPPPVNVAGVAALGTTCTALEMEPTPIAVREHLLARIQEVAVAAVIMRV